MSKLACFMLVALSTSACSVDNVDGVFGSPQSNGGASGEGGSNGPSGNGGDPNGPTVTNGPGNTVTVGPTTTNGPGNTVTNGPSTSTGPDPGGVSLYCANAPCGGGEVCCYYQSAKGQDFCADPGECPDQPDWFEIGCNGPADCATGHCCGKWNNQQGWYEIECGTDCGGDDGFEMCFDDPSVCGGGSCEDSQALGNGYGYCAQ